MARTTSLDALQPELRPLAAALMSELAGSSHDWQVFETWRPASKKCGVANAAVSKTDPCKNPTLHSYGAALDVVPHGKWGGAWNKASWLGWAELRAAAHKVGLSNDMGWDRPHCVIGPPHKNDALARRTCVRWLQKDLGLTQDGSWGPATDAAAKAAASKHGIEWAAPVPTGSLKINPETYVALRDAISSSRLAFGAGLSVGTVAMVAGLAWYLVKRG